MLNSKLDAFQRWRFSYDRPVKRNPSRPWSETACQMHREEKPEPPFCLFDLGHHTRVWQEGR